MKKEDIRKTVRQEYSKVARDIFCCGGLEFCCGAVQRKR
jgi:hypothetical protein